MQRHVSTAFALVIAACIPNPTAIIAQSSVPHDEYEGVSADRAAGFWSASTIVVHKPPEIKEDEPPTVPPETAGPADSSTPSAVDGAKTPDEGGSCGTGDSETSSLSEPSGGGPSHTVNPDLPVTFPRPAGGSSARCAGSAKWNIAPSFKTNPKNTTFTFDSGHNEAGNFWFMDRPRIVYFDAWHAVPPGPGAIIHVRWDAHYYRIFKNTTNPLDLTAGWKAGNLDSDLVIYRDGPGGQSGSFRLYDSTGRVYVFSGTDGQLTEIIGAGGGSITIAYNATGLISIVQQRTHTGSIEIEWEYSYETADARVLREIKARHGGTTLFRTVTFRHKMPPPQQTNEPDANDWDLIGITDHWLPGTGEGEHVRRWAFKYYTDQSYSPSHPGYQYQMRAVIGSHAIKDFPGDIYNTSLASVDPSYIDQQYEYYSDTESDIDDRRRVKTLRLALCGCAGGANGTYQYDYEFNGTDPGTNMNVFKYMVKITPPTTGSTPGIQKIWYNYYGQKLAETYTESNGAPISSGRTWSYFWEYDNIGRLLKEHTPRSITIQEAAAFSFSTSHLQGLIRTYARSDNLTTKTLDIGVTNYATNPSTTIYQQVLEKVVGADGRSKNWVLTGQTAFRSATVTDMAGYSYTFHPDGVGVNTVTIQRPSVSYTDPVESRSNVIEKEYYDRNCLLKWHRDGSGYVHHRQYDPARRLLLRGWRDVSTAAPLPPLVEAVPSGFERDAGLPTALNALTQYEYDAYSRMTARIDPTGQREQWIYESMAGNLLATLYYGHKSATGLPEGPTQITVEDADLGRIVEQGLAYLEQRDADVTNDWTNTWSSLLNAAASGQWTFYERSLTQYTLNGEKAFVYVCKSPDDPSFANYYSTEYRYDALGRNTEIINAVGTRTALSYDDYNRIYQVSTGLSTGPTYVVERRFFDEGTPGVHGTGNGNVTSVERETGVAGDPVRKSCYVYDYRGRLATLIDKTDAAPKYRVTKRAYDDQSNLTVIETYKATTSVDPPTDVDPAASELRGRTEYRYDSWNNVYEARVYEVRQSDGVFWANKYVPTRYWRDSRNLVFKTRGNNSVLSKAALDGLGRSVATFVGFDGTGETGWNLDDADDTVMEESASDYDLAGRVLTSTAYYRVPAATALGRLSGLASTQWRRSAAMYWYDSLGRQTATADYGNAPPSPRPTTAPGYTDPVALLTTTSYDAAGRTYEVSDPMQLVTRHEYDGLSRSRKVTENVGGLNRIRESEYNGIGKTTIMKATTAAGAPQITEYVYGVTTGVDGSTVSSADFLYLIKYPDPATGLASGLSQDQEKFGLNRQGELIWRLDQNGSQHNLKRDAEGRVTEDYLSVVGSGVDSYVRSIRRNYDELGRSSSVTSWSEGGGSGVGRNGVWYTYGNYGEVITVDQSPTSGTAGSASVQYTYQYPDHNTGTKTFRLWKTRYPNSIEYEERYADTAATQLSRPNGITRLNPYPGSPVILHTERYEGLTRMVERELGNATGAIYYRTPDDYGRVRWITLAGGNFGSTPSNNTNYFYCYNKNSQATFRRDLAGSAADVFSESYAYDGLLRLIEWYRGRGNSGTGCGVILSLPTPETQSWTTLDHSNNWGSQWGHTVNKSNELTSGGATYDNNGNYGANGGGKTYDGWNRLVGISQSGYNYGTLRYNGFNQLVSQATDFPYYNHSNDQYYYGIDGRLVEERAWDGYYHAVKKHFVWGGNALDDLVVTWQASTNAYEYSIQDANWNVVANTTGTSSIKERYRYTPYGVPSKITADWAGGGTIYDDIQLYTGQRYNWLNGLYSYKLRFYTPSQGRFLHRDPFGLGHDAENFRSGYSYVGAEPVGRIDPWGAYLRVTGNKKFKDDVESSLEDICSCYDYKIDAAGYVSIKRAHGEYFCCCYCRERAGCNLVKALITDTEFTENIGGPGRNHRDPPGGPITYDPGDWEGEGGQRKPSVGLGHELAHAYLDRGLSPTVKYLFQPFDKGEREIDTSAAENQLREHMGEEPRETTTVKEKNPRTKRDELNTYNVPTRRPIDESDKEKCKCK